MLQGAFAQIGSRADASNPHFAHIALHPLTIDDPVRFQQRHRQLARAIKWMGGVQLVDAVLDRHFLRRWRNGLIVQAPAADAQ